ncbi:hypothetical protein IFR05_001684 [Cadophora sp. M221]|nr:hypothetical protein IFR05_001684 [Cadophora sp. M221]
MSDSSDNQSAGITTSPLLQASDESTQKVLHYLAMRSNQSIGPEVPEIPTSSPGRPTSQSSQPDFQRDSLASRSQSIPTDASVTFTALDLQAPTGKIHSSSQHGSVVIPSATKFRLRDLPAEIRREIYGYAWPCIIQATALLDTLKHDSKLQIKDLERAEEFFNQHHRYTVTAQNYAEFRPLRPLRKMEQITDITIQIDSGLAS